MYFQRINYLPHWTLPVEKQTSGRSHRNFNDTVGFIRKLPHRLIDAFKATLEEALVADLLLHVVDFSCPEYEAQLNTTIEVLR